MSKIVCNSVTNFLEAIEKINKKDGYTYFFRGVPDEKYAIPEHDIPSIFRYKKNDKDTKWVEDEHNMFHRLIAECPDYFNSCTSTFEHLVMMQHYEFPTRLLDITSNPLVALYFACGGFSSLRGAKEISDLDKNGQVLVYEIKNTDIRSHNSDRISILSNLTLAKPNININHFLINQLWHKITNIDNASKIQIQQLNNMFNEHKDEDKPLYYLKYAEIFISLFKKEKLLDLVKKINITSISNVTDDKNILMIDQVLKLLKEMLILLEDDEEWIQKILIPHNKQFKLSISTNDNQKIKKIMAYLSHIQYFIESLNPTLFDQTIFNQFTYNIINEKSGFNPNIINPDHISSIQCVIPKKNNPRIIAQQGLFLLFGIKDGGSKIDVPNIDIDIDMYAKDDHNEIINIKVDYNNDAKINILKQLKELGISNKSLFPEINNISYEIKNEFI